MALINPETLEIPPVHGRWWKVKPCGTGAAYRRHFRHGGCELPVDRACAAWHRKDVNNRYRKAKS